MGEFKFALKPYDLRKALAADSGVDCLVIDVGRNKDGLAVPSLANVLERVDYFLHHARDTVFAAAKLYITGDWVLTPHEAEADANSEAQKTKQARIDSVEKWTKAIEKIGELMQQMGNLKELTWMSGLPFTAVIWKKIPTLLTKLVLDLGEPVRLELNGNVLHKSRITPDEMKLLQEQVKLKELRLFRVYNSFQPLVWETVFRNTSESGMRVLDLQMVAAPIVRFEQWKKAKDVAGLTVALEDSEEKYYKGMDGKGILHYAIGTGEYLDDYCIRKARIASGLDEAKPLPLWCLKLDGFVIDHLPFAHELSGIVLLTCGEHCIDSGLRAPKTGRPPHNKWSKAVNNATSHCLIKWPNWTGIFDDHGDQRNKLGLVIPQDAIFSTPLEDFSPSSPFVPLTKESLQMKELGEAIADAKTPDNFESSHLLGEPAIATSSMSLVSNKSERGSEVPTPTGVFSRRVSAVDGTDLTMVTSFGSSDMTTVGSVVDTMSPTSTASSFEQVDNAISDDTSIAANGGSETTLTEGSNIPKNSTLAHKVRQSIGWLPGSSSS